MPILWDAFLQDYYSFGCGMQIQLASNHLLNCTHTLFQKEMLRNSKIHLQQPYRNQYLVHNTTYSTFSRLIGNQILSPTFLDLMISVAANLLVLNGWFLTLDVSTRFFMFCLEEYQNKHVLDLILFENCLSEEVPLVNTYPPFWSANRE